MRIDKHIDMVPRRAALEAWLVVDAVLCTQRQMNAAHALEGADIVDRAVFAPTIPFLATSFRTCQRLLLFSCGFVPLLRG